MDGYRWIYHTLPLTRHWHIPSQWHRHNFTVDQADTYTMFRLTIWWIASWNQIYIPSIIYYKTHPIPKHKCFSSRLAVVFAQSVDVRCKVENEDLVGAAPTGDATTTYEWPTMLLPTKVRLILDIYGISFCMLFTRHVIKRSWFESN